MGEQRLRSGNDIHAVLVGVHGAKGEAWQGCMGRRARPGRGALGEGRGLVGVHGAKGEACVGGNTTVPMLRYPLHMLICTERLL